jgi:hypothetical protein
VPLATTDNTLLEPETMVAAAGWVVIVGPLVVVLAALVDDESELLPQPDNSNDNEAA